MLSHYDGAGRGWAESSLAPAEFNRRSSSDAQDDKVLLTAITGKPPQGFEQVRPGAWCALVPLSDCEIFERVYTANLNGVPARLLRHGDGKAHVLLLTDDPQAAQRVGAKLIEPAVYEVITDAQQLTNIQGLENYQKP